jgi:hypothetical protein
MQALTEEMLISEGFCSLELIICSMLIVSINCLRLCKEAADCNCFVCLRVLYVSLLKLQNFCIGVAESLMS